MINSIDSDVIQN